MMAMRLMLNRSRMPRMPTRAEQTRDFYASCDCFFPLFGYLLLGDALILGRSQNALVDGSYLCGLSEHVPIGLPAIRPSIRAAGPARRAPAKSPPPFTASGDWAS